MKEKVWRVSSEHNYCAYRENYAAFEKFDAPWGVCLHAKLMKKGYLAKCSEDHCPLRLEDGK